MSFWDSGPMPSCHREPIAIKKAGKEVAHSPKLNGKKGKHPVISSTPILIAYPYSIVRLNDDLVCALAWKFITRIEEAAGLVGGRRHNTLKSFLESIPCYAC
ncbi:uncharacterized protein Bfra_002062 [Botrytis fragariae]|uniref:Uncharacterized protein n=1 Tax=Botrytis fragariae TaxID=1964551 RepID=A0A8H6EMM5_9HELO|nr:uncharacterized protein Bfra_002062 [Botrytis fragariae]KAF5877694.1 hypothetical protein Bfra_002062 [Botrytis fragariae]